jgi:hypothetical protein
MRTIRLITLGLITSMLWVLARPLVHSQQSVSLPSRIQSFDLDRLDPTKSEDWVKILLVLRSEEIPREQRLTFARRQLREEYKLTVPAEEEHIDLLHCYGMLIEESISTIARLDDIDSIPLLEQKLVLWEQEAQKPPHERKLPIPNLKVARAALARLKAVQEIPHIRTADDLVQRLQRMLVHIGHEGTVQAWLSDLEKEVSYNWRMSHPGLGINELVLRHYGRMVLQAGWNGVNVAPACEIIRFNPKPEGIIKELWATYVELAQKPRQQVAQWIVDDAMKWDALRVREECLSQVLLNLGTSVVPIIQEKLSWALRNRDQIEGSGIGLAALVEVLVTLAGEKSLPFLDPFTQDKNEWVRHYACRAKEYIQQGKVFLFAPYF